jgi:hypothetical protein
MQRSITLSVPRNAGLNADWQALVAAMRDRHSRKKGFMVGFEDIVSGAPKLSSHPFWNVQRHAGQENRKSSV